MTDLRTLRFLFAALVAAILPLEATAQALRPVAEVRALARYQDAMTQGSRSSIEAQGVLIARISQSFQRAPVKTWSVWRNTIAAVKYLISGGDPTFAENDALIKAVPKELQPMLLAALAYARGEAGRAKKLFAGIDPREIDPSLGGHVALVKSLLIYAKDPKASMNYLDDARLLGAGTLVEEAAIRRQLGMAVNRRDQKRFQLLAMRYVSRYQKSVFASAFREHLATGLTDDWFKLDEERSAWLRALLGRMDRSVRPQYTMVIAERAIIRGRSQLVRIAAAQLREDVGRSSGFGQRAKLFTAAMGIVEDGSEKALADLAKLTDFPAGSFEDKLRKAALVVAKGIAMPVEEEVAASPKSRDGGKSGNADAGSTADAFSGTRSAALSALQNAKGLLAR